MIDVEYKAKLGESHVGLASLSYGQFFVDPVSRNRIFIPQFQKIWIGSP